MTWTQKFFADKNICSARLDAELLLSYSLQLRRLDLYLKFDQPLNPDELAAYRKLIRRRADGEPVAYITGVKEFWSREFKVTHDVLIPRPDTEVLIEEVLARLPDDAEGLSVLDLCTGSGAIAITLAAERPQLSVTATDCSPEALQVAMANAENHDVAGRVQFIEGELYNAAQGQKFDIIVSNPPYVTKELLKTVSAEVKMEPKLALDGGEDGLHVVRPLVAGAPEHLVPGGWLLVEIGSEQGEPVRELFSRASFTEIMIRADYAGNDRVVCGKLSQ